MKLEARDELNKLVCCATVVKVRGADVCTNFDGWDKQYDVWAHPYSGILQPVGWCKEHGVELTPPEGTALSRNQACTMLPLIYTSPVRHLHTCIRHLFIIQVIKARSRGRRTSDKPTHILFPNEPSTWYMYMPRYFLIDVDGS